MDALEGTTGLGLKVAQLVREMEPDAGRAVTAAAFALGKLAADAGSDWATVLTLARVAFREAGRKSCEVVKPSC